MLKDGLHYRYLRSWRHPGNSRSSGTTRPSSMAHNIFLTLFGCTSLLVVCSRQNNNILVLNVLTLAQGIRGADGRDGLPGPVGLPGTQGRQMPSFPGSIKCSWIQCTWILMTATNMQDLCRTCMHNVWSFCRTARHWRASRKPWMARWEADQQEKTGCHFHHVQEMLPNYISKAIQDEYSKLALLIHVV